MLEAGTELENVTASDNPTKKTQLQGYGVPSRRSQVLADISHQPMIGIRETLNNELILSPRKRGAGAGLNRWEEKF